MLATGNKSLNTYKLSIRVSPDGFSFSILNGRDGSLVQQDDINTTDGQAAHEVLAEALKRPYLMDYKFTNTELVVASPGICIPLEYFRREEIVANYRLNYPDQPISLAELQYQILPTLETVILFRLNPQVLKIVKMVYPETQLVSLEGRILEEMAEKDRKSQDHDTHFYCICSDKKMQICTFKNGHLQYNGIHNVTNDADRIFYLLSIWKNLGMNTEKNACYISGASNQLMTSIKKYILKVETCE